MNSSTPQFELMEENLKRLGAKMADLPAAGILICRLVQHIGREMTIMFEHQLKHSGLAEAEFRVLTTLFSQPDGAAHPGDLCVRASQSPANMSRISDALVSGGLITRVLSEQDRRRMVLRITAKGEDLVRSLLPNLWLPLHKMLQDFPAEEQCELVEQLKRLGAHLERAMAHQGPGSAL